MIIYLNKIAKKKLKKMKCPTDRQQATQRTYLTGKKSNLQEVNVVWNFSLLLLFILIPHVPIINHPLLAMIYCLTHKIRIDGEEFSFK